MALLREEDDHNHEDERRKKALRADIHLTGEFVIVAKFGDLVLSCLASSLSNVAGR